MAIVGSIDRGFRIRFGHRLRLRTEKEVDKTFDGSVTRTIAYYPVAGAMPTPSCLPLRSIPELQRRGANPTMKILNPHSDFNLSYLPLQDAARGEVLSQVPTENRRRG